MSKALSLSKDYLIFSFITIATSLVVTIVLVSVIFVNKSNNNLQILKRETQNIQITIAESFNHTNKINSHLGRQIADHGVNDLRFILDLFRDADKIQHKNTDLLSWSSFDWVSSGGYQLVNSRVGIRKDPPYMSKRQYTANSPKYPWTLQVSQPVLGNPSKSWVIPAGTGITDKNNRYLGLIAVGFSIAEFETKIEQRINSGVSFAVLDEHLNLVFQSRDSGFERDDQYFKKNINLDVFDKKSGVLKSKIVVNDIYYSYYSKLDKYPYVVLTGYNKSFLNQEFKTLILPRILELVGVTLFFLAILYLFKTRIMVLIATERKLRHSLYVANKAKTKLIRVTSHDLKNYIFGISGLAKMILDKKTASQITKNEDLQLVDTIQHQSQELLYFVEDLLDTNQSESGELTLGKMEPLNVRDLLDRIVLLNRSLAITSKVVIEVNVDEDLPRVEGNMRRLKQIFANLISNAIKFSHSDGVVKIFATYLKGEDQVFIQIEDGGIGMSGEEIKMAMSGRGISIDKSNLEKDVESYGIGISIVSKLVKLHKGKFEIESVKGEGSKVKLYFKAHKKKTKKKGEKSAAKIKGKKILLVEDNIVNIKVISMVLKNAGHKTSYVLNGRDAIEMLSREYFDLILMDGEMPIMDGYEATKKIRSGKFFEGREKNKDIPIIALMAHFDDDVVARINECGMNNYLDKSSTKSKLLDMVESYFKVRNLV